MTKISELTPVTDILDGDLLYLRRSTDTGDPDKSAPGSAFFPNNARITDLFTFDDDVTVPAITAGAVGVATFAMSGAVEGDALIVNPTNALTGGLAIISARISAADTAALQILNSSAVNYAGGAVPMTALALRAA
jgi:hypothetical protein